MKRGLSICIIGGGIVGCAIAYKLSEKYKKVTVVEKNKTIPGLNQSSTNEGAIHSGIYYPKDIMPLKAKLCVEGNALMYDFLQKHNIPFKKVGKLIIATNSKEEEYLDFFLKVGIENGVSAVKKISGSQAHEFEPNIANVIAALFVPQTGCTSPDALIKKIKSLAEKGGVRFLLNRKVTHINHHSNKFKITMQTNSQIETTEADIIINSAGLYSDEIAKLINPKSNYQIDPTRGEFFQFDKSQRLDIWMNGMHVYQPPYCYIVKNGKMKIVNISARDLPKKLKKGGIVITAGVHLSPNCDEVNKVTISPLKTTGLGKENYIKNLHPVSDCLKEVNYFFPNLRMADLRKDHTGIMAVLKGHRDFVIEKDSKYPNFINLVGMESPAWTAALAIAKYVKQLLET